MRLSKIPKNALALFSSQVYNKLTGAVFCIIAARLLGIANFGKFTLVLTFLSFFYIISDWGLSTLTIRDVAREEAETKEYLIYTIILRIAIALISYIALIALVFILAYPKEIIILIIIAGLSLFSNNVLNSFNAILNAYERMYIPSIMCMIFNTIFLLIGALCLYLNLGLITLISVIVILSLINTILTGSFLKEHLTPFKFQIPRTPWMWGLIKKAAPFAILSALSIIYFRVDTIILSKLKTIETVGFYNAAYKFVEFLMFIPTSLLMAYFPQMSKQAKSSKSKLRKNYLKIISLLLIIIMPIAIFLTFWGNHVILILFGRVFLPSGAALKILIWAVVIMFINAPFGNILYNSDKILRYIPYQILLTLINITLNLILIPKLSFLGAAYTTLITEIIALAIQLCFIKQILFSKKSSNE